MTVSCGYLQNDHYIRLISAVLVGIGVVSRTRHGWKLGAMLNGYV